MPRRGDLGEGHIHGMVPGPLDDMKIKSRVKACPKRPNDLFRLMDVHIFVDRYRDLRMKVRTAQGAHQDIHDLSLIVWSHSDQDDELAAARSAMDVVDIGIPPTSRSRS